jgi:sugar lactone lactonase YvrE
MNGRISGRFSRLDRPTDLAVDNSDGSVWVADTLSNGLMKFDSAGALLNSLETYKKILALAVHPATSDLWALSRDSLGVLIFSRNGEPRRISHLALTRPADIDIDSRTGKVWIADGRRVIKLNERGQPDSLASTPFRFVKRLAADETSGGCWLIDYSTSINASYVVKLTPNGAPAFDPITGFDLPNSLAVNPHDGSCLVADTGNRRLIRIAADGRILSSYNQISAPFDLDTAQ